MKTVMNSRCYLQGLEALENGLPKRQEDTSSLTAVALPGTRLAPL